MPGLLCGTWAEQEKEMPQQQWWPAEEHLIFFGTALLGTFAIGHISVTLQRLLRRRLCAEVWLEIRNIASYSAVWQHAENPTIGNWLFRVSVSLLTTLAQISLLSDAD